MRDELQWRLVDLCVCVCVMLTIFSLTSDDDKLNLSGMKIELGKSVFAFVGLSAWNAISVKELTFKLARKSHFQIDCHLESWQFIFMLNDVYFFLIVSEIWWITRFHLHMSSACLQLLCICDCLCAQDMWGFYIVSDSKNPLKLQVEL